MKIKAKELLKVIPKEELIKLMIKWNPEDTLLIEDTMDGETAQLGLVIFKINEE